MKRSILVSAATLLLITGNALAQASTEQMKGTWRGEFPPCGQITMVITGVDARTGAVTGTFDCPKMGKAAMGGELIKGKQLGAKIKDKEFQIRGSTSKFDLTFDGATLTGMGGPNDLPGIPVTLTK